MLFGFHLDGDLNNEGTAEASSYKLTKTGSDADSFSTTARFGGKSLQGDTSNSYILTAATPGDALVSNAGGWTLSMWVNFNGGGVMWRDVAGFSIGNKYYQIQRTNNNTYNIYGGSGTISKEIPGKTTSDWVNIVFVMAAGSDKSVKIYADGGAVGTYSATDSLAGTGAAGLTSVSIGRQVLKAINGATFEYYGRAQSGLIDEVAVYNFSANEEQIGWLAANAPSEEMFGPIVQPDKTAYYKSGYIGDHASTAADALKLTETSGGTELEYNRTYGNWTLIIDENSPAGAQAWCSDTVKYNDRTMKLVKVIIKRDFTLKPGVTDPLFDGVEFEVAAGAKLTLTKDSSRNMSVGSVTFSGAGTIDAATGVTFTKDVSVKGDVQVDMPAGTPFVAKVGDDRFTTLAAALAAAGDDGLVEVLVNSLAGGNIPDSWRGTVRFSGELAAGFNPSNYGNANSIVEFKGASGYLVNSGSFAGTLKLTNDGETPAWRITNGFKEDNFVIARLTGDGDLVDASSSNVQQFSFADASTFGGSITTEGKRFVIGSATHGSSSQYTARIYVEKGHVARVAEGKTFSGKWGMIVDGTIKGSGTLACPSDKKVIFGFANDGAPTIDLSEGALTVAEGCAVQFNKPLTLKNAEEGAVVLRCASKPANLETVQLKDAEGNVMPLAHLEYAEGQVTLTGASKKLVGATTWTVTAEEMTLVPQDYTLDLSGFLALDIAPVVLPAGTTAEAAQTFLAKLAVIPPAVRPNASLAVSGTSLALAYEPMTLYWAAWRGTFWEHIGQADVNGNHGLMRDETGNLNIAHRPNDTVVFDRSHYTVDGDYLTTAYWHYDENLYIKNEVQPGDANDWDLKILEGVTLKMGLRGSRAEGQNVINDLKIFVEEGSTLELGYWGNTHHYQGVLRDDVVFGGGGRITFGADLGPSLRAEGDILVKEHEAVPTMNLNGKELVLCGKTDATTTIAVNLTGFGSIVAEKPGVHLTGDVAFGSTATIDASNAANMLTLDNSATFGSNLTVKLTEAQVSSLPVKVLALGDGATVSMTATDVRVLVNGSPVAAFYELYQDGNGLYVRVKEGAKIAYGSSAAEGYDFVGSLVTVTMDPAVEDLPITVTVNGRDWTGTIGAEGSGVVMIGDEDTFLDSGTYDYTVHVGEETLTGSLFVGNRWFEADPASGSSVVIGGEWDDQPLVDEGAYQLDEKATFEVSDDKAAGEIGVVEFVITFAGGADDEMLDEVADRVSQSKGALVLKADENGTLAWNGLIGGNWVELTGVEAAEGTYRVRTEYDRTATPARMRYLIGTSAVSPLAGEATDEEGWFPASSATAFAEVSFIGSGTLSKLEGFVEDPALVEYAGVKYKSMEEAVAEWTKAGKSGVITLLTNIFFAPEPGTYSIAKNGHALYLTNDMIIEREEGTTVVVGFPQSVDRYTNGLQLSGESAPFIIDGEWLGKAIAWKRHSLIQTALLEKPATAQFARWQSYLLGFAPEEVETANAVIRGVQTSDTDKLYVTDGLPIRAVDETGVAVTRVLKTGAAIDSIAALGEQPAATDEGMPVALDMAAGAVKYVQLAYSFAADPGQDASLVPTSVIADPAQVTFGILRVATEAKETILSVPWLGGDGEAVTVADYLKTANLQKGDMLSLFNPGAGNFTSWIMAEDGTWTGAARVADTGIAPAAEPTTALSTGAALILSRKNASSCVYLFGQTGTVPAPTTVKAGAYNLITPSIAQDVNLNDIAMTGTPSALDFLRLDETTLLTYKATKGGWGRTVYNEKTHISTFDTSCAVIKAGQGLIYMSRGGAPTFDWTKGKTE